jgi:hypothetical protein
MNTATTRRHDMRTPITFDRMPLNTARPMLGTPSAVVEECGMYRGSTIVGQFGRCHTGEYVVTLGTNDNAIVLQTRADAAAFVRDLA